MKNELREHLKTFIGFRTTPERPEEKGKCLDWAYQNFLKSDVPVERDAIDGAPYLYIQHPSPKLLWFAHIDVVPAADELFFIREDEKLDHFLGRGVKDMKGATLCFLLAYRDALKSGAVPPVSILLSSDEETAGQTIPKLLKAGKLKAPVAFTPDTGSNPEIVVEHKGVVWADMIIHGRGGHAAMPWRSQNPVYLLADVLQILRKEFPIIEDGWVLSVTPAMLTGSGARNQVPEECVCSLDIRFPPEECRTVEEAVQRVEKVLPEYVEIRVIQSAPPLATDPNHPMVKLVQTIGSEVTKTSVEIGREHGASDARYFSEQGIPAFLFGPIGGDLHAASEWVSIASLEEHYEFSARFLAAL